MSKDSYLIVTGDQASESFTREDFIFLAKMSEQCERFDEMLGFVRKFVSMSDKVLTPEEKHVFAAAYKNAVGNRRAELKVLTVIEQKEQRNTNVKDGVESSITAYKKTITKELSDLCHELIDLIDKKLLQSSKFPLNEIYFKKMRGDYFRYLAECMSESDSTAIIDSCSKSYQEADKIAKNNIPPTHPLRLGLQLNMSVFEFEILQNPGRAIQIASTALDEAFANIDKIRDEYFKESTLIMQLLRDNLTLWSNQSPGTEAQDG
jgi:14-3-3 protein epsilon